MEAVYSAQNPRDSEGLQVAQPPLRNEGSPVLPTAPQGQYVPQSPSPYPPSYASPISQGVPEKPYAPHPAVVVTPVVSRRKFDISQRLFWLIIIAIILVIGGIIGGAIGGVIAARNNSKSQSSRTTIGAPEPNIKTTSTGVTLSSSMPTTMPSKSNGISASMPTLSARGATQESVCTGRICPRLLSAISLSSSQYNVFGVGLDIALWTYSTNTPSWDSLGGGVTSSPAISVGCTTPMEAFVVGTDRALYHKTWDGSSWAAWSSLGGGLLSPPAVTLRAPGLLDVYVVGTDSALYWSWCSSGQWTTWAGLGGVLESPLAVASWDSNRDDIFGIGSDNAMWHMAWDQDLSPQWSNWESLGGVFSSEPVVVTRGSGQLDLFGVGSDDAAWYRSYDNDTWSVSWVSLGGSFESSIVAVVSGTDQVDIFGVGLDGGLYTKQLLGLTWSSSWTSLGGILNSAPEVIRTGDNSITVFGVGLDTSVWTLSRNAGVWTSWVSLGGLFELA